MVKDLVAKRVVNGGKGVGSDSEHTRITKKELKHFL